MQVEGDKGCFADTIPLTGCCCHLVDTVETVSLSWPVQLLHLVVITENTRAVFDRLEHCVTKFSK